MVISKDSIGRIALDSYNRGPNPTSPSLQVYRSRINHKINHLDNQWFGGLKTLGCFFSKRSFETPKGSVLPK